ncbi:MAG: HAMP domain-containing histidine kinase [Cyclobacteriaceae bacterium]|nr:HAMP domain-containing histidine kinase [Cyclobacteriaceae bacterium]
MIFDLGKTEDQVIVVGGKEIIVKTKPEWIFYKGADPVLQLFMIKDNLLVIQSVGDVPKNEYSNIFMQIENIILQSPVKMSVLAYSNVPFLGREIRIFIIREEERLRNYLDKYYFISKGKGKSLLNVYKNMHPVFRKKLLVLDSINEAILEHIHEKSENIPDITQVFPIEAYEKDYPIEVKWRGYFLSIRHLESWSYKTNKSTFSGFLVNNKILVYRVSGSVDEQFGLKIFQIGKQIVKHIDNGKAIIISDYSNVKRIDKHARIVFEKLNFQSDKARILEFVNSNTLMEAVISIQLMVQPGLRKKLIVCQTFDEALFSAIEKINQQGQTLYKSKDRKLDSYSSSQLKRIILNLNEELEQTILNRSERIDQFIEMFSKITWQQDFSFKIPTPDEEDPFYNLFTAFYFLKKDLNNLFKEVKVLNEELEVKVREKAGDILNKEANLESVIEATNDLIFSVDTDLNIIVMNYPFREFVRINFDVDLKSGDSFLKVLRTDSLKHFWVNNLKTSFQGKSFSLTERWKTNMGEIIFVNISFNPIVSNDLVTGVSIFVKDFTEEVESKNLLKTKNDELVSLNKQLDRFIYSASHELRSPLSSLMGLINNFRKENEKKSKELYLDLMEGSVHKMDAFIKEILYYTKNARSEIKMEKIDFRKILIGIINEWAFEIDINSIDVELNVNDNIKFKSDKFRIELILNNIIGNSIKFIDSKKKNHKLSISVDVNNFLEIVISDNGRGISEEYKEKVFEMFFRGHEDVQGTGLGLFLVKEAVSALEGQIFLTSELNKGTEFKVILPKHKAKK